MNFRFSDISCFRINKVESLCMFLDTQTCGLTYTLIKHVQMCIPTCINLKTYAYRGKPCAMRPPPVIWEGYDSLFSCHFLLPTGQHADLKRSQTLESLPMNSQCGHMERSGTQDTIKVISAKHLFYHFLVSHHRAPFTERE